MLAIFVHTSYFGKNAKCRPLNFGCSQTNILKVCLDTVYFAEIENLLLKVL